MMIELDRPLFEYLRERFPQMRVINGDATRLVDILRQQGVDEVGTVISGMPDGQHAARVPARDHRAGPGRDRARAAACCSTPIRRSRRSRPRSSAST